MIDENVRSAVTPRQQWAALIAAVCSIVAAGSYTTLAGLLSTKFINELGWSPSAISIGVGINMALYGVTAPFAIFVMEKYGIRRVSVWALCVLIAGSIVCLVPNVAVFNVSWGLLVGLGTGSLTMAYGALVARNWFGANQGTVAGVLTASAVLGQFALLPIWAEVAAAYGWRAPLIGSAALAALAMVVNIALMGDERSIASEVEVAEARNKRFLDIFAVLFAAMKSNPFWVLVGLFIICGATTNGIMWSHFTPAANEAGMTTTAASSVLFLIGVFNVLGTVSAGWLADRMSPRLILAFVFFGRAATLLWLPLIIASGLDVQMVAFGVLFGILDVATVPPVIALCNRVFGREGPAIFGWVNAFHQLGAGVMAFSGGVMRETVGSYDPLWITAGVLCAVAVLLAYASRYREHSLAGAAWSQEGHSPQA